MAPKSKRSARSQEPFLFVNEDFNTLFGGAKNTELDRSKQSHVQRQSFAKRKRLPRGGKASETTSPSPTESASTPISGAGQTVLRSPSEIQSPELPFHASESFWLPTATREASEAAQSTSGRYSSRPEISTWNAIPNAPGLEPRFTLLGPQQSQAENENVTGFIPSFFGDALMSTPSAIPTRAEDFTASNFAPTLPLADPFTNTQAALELWAPTLMKYFTMQMVPEVFHTDLRAVQLENMRHVEWLHADMTSCMSHAAEMYALLAASACHAMGRDGRLYLPGLAEEDSSRVVLLFKSKALEALRHRLLSSTPNHRTVIAVQRMVCAALYIRNFSAVEAHYRAAMAMMEQIGGLETFDDFQKERLIMDDLSYALCTKSQPKFQLTWDPGSLDEGINAEIFAQLERGSDIVTGSRIMDMDANIVISSTLARGVQELVEAQHAADWLKTQEYIPAQYRWLVHRRLAIVHRLLGTEAGSESDPSASRHYMEVIRLALLCYMVLVGAVALDYNSYADLYVIPELQSWQTNGLDSTFDSCQDLLLWILTLFGACLTSGTGQESRQPTEEGLEVRRYGVELGKQICVSLEIANEQQMRNILQRFLFDDEIVGRRYLDFVNDIVMKRN